MPVFLCGSKNEGVADVMPTNKVNAGGITASIAVVIAWAAKEFWRIEVPTEIGIAIAGIFTYVIQYVVPDK